MICPTCGKTMRKGYIPSGKSRLAWYPEGEAMPMTVFSKNPKAVILSKLPLLAVQEVESYYCERCAIVVTPVDGRLNEK